MSCEIIATKGAVFSLWGKPQRADMDRIEAQIRTSVAEFGGPVVYITRVPVEAPAPDPEVRKYLNSIMPRIMQSCSTYHVVLEGNGFLAAMKRGIVTSLFQLGFRGGSFFVHSTVQEIEMRVDRRVRPNVAAVVELADRRGLLRRSAPASSTPPRPSPPGP